MIFSRLTDKPLWTGCLLRKHIKLFFTGEFMQDIVDRLENALKNLLILLERL